MLLVFKRLFTELDVYLELSAKSWWSVLKVFLLGLFLVALINGVAATLISGPKLLQSLIHLADTAVSWWPAAQIGHWQNGQLTFTPTPLENRALGWPITPPDQFTTHLAIYSPTNLTQPNVSPNGSGNALFVLSPTQFWLNQLNGEWSAPQPLNQLPGLSELPPGDYTQATFADLVGKIHASVRRALIGLLILWPFLSGIGSLFSMAWFVVTEAALVWLVTRIFGWNLSWKRLVKLNCLLVIPASVLQYGASWLYPNLSFSLFNVTYWILLSLLLLIGSKELEKTTT